MDIEELDAIVHGLFREISAEIDCRSCGNCCRKISPVLDQEDIEKLSMGQGISPEDVKRQFLMYDDDFSEGLIFNEMPCPFLKGNQCSSYEFRPEACRSFPHLHKDEFVSRLMGVVQNYEICPVVFNVYEQLKKKFSWPKRFNSIGA